MHQHFWFQRARSAWRTLLTIAGILLLFIFGRRAISHSASIQAMGPAHRAFYPIGRAVNDLERQAVSAVSQLATFSTLSPVRVHAATQVSAAPVQPLPSPQATPLPTAAQLAGTGAAPSAAATDGPPPDTAPNQDSDTTGNNQQPASTAKPTDRPDPTVSTDQTVPTQSS